MFVATNSEPPEAPKAETTRWYVVQTQPNRETIALKHLARQGFETYCPYRNCVRKVARNYRQIRQPFFRGYIFVKIDISSQRWRSVNSTVGVSRLVQLNSNGAALPTPLPGQLIQQLIEMTDNDGVLRIREHLKAGDRVRVMGGPFDENIGILESAGDLERVTILLNILSKSTRVQIDRHFLRQA